MKITVFQENLAKALATVGRVVESRPALPVMANVLLVTEEARLRVTATNLELNVTAWAGANVAQPGRITVHARTLSELVNNLPPGNVTLDLDEATRTVTVRSAATVANIRGIDAGEFPNVPVGSEPDLSVPARVLKEMIRHTEFAAAKEENRPVLTAIYVRLDGDTMTMAAADGYRLAVRNARIETPVSPAREVLVPARAMGEVARMVVDHEDDPIYITLPGARDMVMFSTRHAEVSSQVLEGRYPDFRAIIPQSYSTSTLIETSDLLRAAKRAEIFARDNANSAKLVLRPAEGSAEPGELRISSRSAERGDNSEPLYATVEGQAIEVSFNVRYLIDVLNVIAEDRVLFESSGPTSPGVVRPEGRDDFVHVIMPMSNNR